MKNREHLTCDIHLVLIKDNKLLMLQRGFDSKYMPGFFHFPAGHKEQYDGCIYTLLKETKEETNLNVYDPKLIHTMYHKANGERIALFFLCNRYAGELINMEPTKHETIQWFDLTNIPEKTVPYAKYALQCILNKEYYSEFSS